VPLYPPQIPQWMAWNRKQASAVRGRRITDWVTVRIRCLSSASLMHWESNCKLWGSNSGADEGSWILRYYTVSPGEIGTDVLKKHSASIIRIKKAWILNKKQLDWPFVTKETSTRVVPKSQAPGRPGN
jgi:hypothetical protein